MVFHWSFSDSKCPWVSRTHLGILTNLNYGVIWMVFTCPIISKSSCPCTSPSVTVPRAPITISMIVTFMFHNFFHSLARSWYLFFFSLSSARTANTTILQFLYFLFVCLIITWSSCLAKIRWSVCMSKSQKSLCISFSRTEAGLCIYHLLYGQISISCTIPSGSPCLPNHV